MSKLEIPGEVLSQLNIAIATPAGNVGIDMRALPGAMKPSVYIVTAVVTSAPSDLLMYGAMPAGTAGDSTDDRWGLINDRYNRIVAGKIGTGLAVGTHHFIVEELGVFDRLFFGKSAGAIDVFVTPIYKSFRGN